MFSFLSIMLNKCNTYLINFFVSLIHGKLIDSFNEGHITETLSATLLVHDGLLLFKKKFKLNLVNPSSKINYSDREILRNNS